MLRKYCIVLVFFLICSNAFAVDKHFLDSVKNVFNHSQDNRKKLECLNHLSFQYGFIDGREALRYCRMYLEAAVSANDSAAMVTVYNNYGNAYEGLADFDSAIWYHKRSLDLAERVSIPNIPGRLVNIALCYKEQGDYRNALNNFLKAREYIEQDRVNKFRVARFHYYIAEMLLSIGDHATAENYIRAGMSKGIEGELYPHLQLLLGKLYHVRGKNDSAIFILEEAVQNLRKEEDILTLAAGLSNLGMAYAKKQDHKKALTCFTEELQLQERLKNESGICLANLNIANTKARMNASHTEVYKHLLQAEGRLKGISRNGDVLKRTYLKISETYELMHEASKAYDYFKRYSALSDSLLNKEKFLQINDLNTKYETAKKEKQIKQDALKLLQQNSLLEKRQFQIIIILFLFLSVAVFTLFAYNRYRSKQKLKWTLELQKQEQLREAAIKEKEYQERIRIAKDLHDEIGSGISKIALMAEYSRQYMNTGKPLNDNIHSISKTSQELIENMRDLVWALNSENITLSNLVARINEFSSVFLEELPVAVDFQVSGTVPELIISKEVHRNIFMTFKEALNNSAKHANAQAISIAVHVEAGQMTLSISDDGKGFRYDGKKRGNGLFNMKQRIESFGGCLDILSEPGKGTTIRIVTALEKMTEKTPEKNHILM